MIRCITIRVTHFFYHKKEKDLLLSLWVCGREASECGQVMGNALALSMTCPYVPKDASWSEGLVHISTDCRLDLFSRGLIQRNRAKYTLQFFINYPLKFEWVQSLVYFF